MKFRILLVAVCLLAGFSISNGQEKFRVYLGTYTGTGSKGVYQCEFDTGRGSLSKPELAVETSSPSFLAFHPTRNFLYAVNEDIAAISSFSIDDHTGKLTFLNQVPSKGGAPCHLSVDPSGKNVLAANYTGGSCICVRLGSDGKLGRASSFHKHSGKRTHGHAIHVDRSNRFAFCCDLGLDQVIIYKFDSTKGKLTHHGVFDTKKGAGPRHFAWHPNGNVAYVNGETDLTVMVCDYDSKTGMLTGKQVLSTLPEDVKRNGGSTAETVVHPSGKFVYVSNRDPYNSIAIFRVDSKTGKLTSVGHQGKGIKTPRNYAIDPTGKFMLVANQSGNDVLVFRIDQESGKLIPTGTRIEVPRPVCVRFRKLKQD